MKKYFLLAYFSVLFTLTTALLICLYPYVEDPIQMALYYYLGVAGYLGCFLSYKAYRSHSSSKNL